MGGSEAICCCLQTCNVAASEEIVGEDVYQLLLSSTVQFKLESKVSPIITCCLRLFVVVYKVEMLQNQR